MLATWSWRRWFTGRLHRYLQEHDLGSARRSLRLADAPARSAPGAPQKQDSWPTLSTRAMRMAGLSPSFPEMKAEADAAVTTQVLAMLESEREVAEPALVVLGPSSIPGAGGGVHARADIAAGTVVCFYPGTVYATEATTPADLAYNAYQIHTAEGVLLDPLVDAHAPARWIEEDELGAWVARATAGWQQRHRLSLAHLVNHPRAGGQPNCINWPIKLSAQDLERHRNAVPSLQMHDTAGDTDDDDEDYGDAARAVPPRLEPSPHVLVLLAVDDVARGMELTMDYRLGVGGVSEGPVWFTAVEDPHLPRGADAVRR
jgi:hypothetical protein